MAHVVGVGHAEGHVEDNDDNDIVDIDEIAENHEFGALNTLFGTTVLICCILLAYIIRKDRVFFITESAAVILLGLVVGYFAAMFHPSTSELEFLSFRPEVFYFFLLPPIVFDAGYTCRRKDFFSNIVPILLFAVVGTFISTFLIAMCVFSLGKMNFIDINTHSSIESLLFGAMISAVNPVATLSVMDLIMGSESPGENCDKLLYSIVFGESVLNDAVAINLFHSFLKFHESSRDEISDGLILKAMMDFVLSSLGGVGLGSLIGFACCYFCKNTDIKATPHLELVTVYLFAYIAYSLNESVGFSGIIALFFCGIVLAHYNSYNLSQQNRATAEVCTKTLANISENFVFLYLGLGFCTGRFTTWSPVFIISAIVLCYIARFCNIFPLAYISNLTKHSSKKINRKMQTMIWFSGLPGAISFALAQSMPGKHHDLFVTTTLSVVIFSTVVMGGLTAPMLTCTGMRTINDDGRDNIGEEMDSEDDEQSLLVPKTSATSTNSKSTTTTTGSTDNGSVVVDSTNLTTSRRTWVPKKGIRNSWRDFEDKYIKPTFGGSSCEPPSPSPLFKTTSSSSSTNDDDSVSSSVASVVNISHRKIDHRTSSSSSVSSVSPAPSPASSSSASEV